MDDGAHVVAGVLEGNVKLVHKLLIARQDGLSVHHRLDAVAGDLFGVGDPVGVGGGLAGRLDGPGDGVVAEPLRQGGQLQQLTLAHLLGMYGGHLEGAPGEGARLVKDHNAGLSQGLQVVAPLHQDALFAGPADAPEEGQGDGDDQGTGAGDHQEVQGPLHPHEPGAQPQQGRQHRQGQGGKDHCRGVVPGKSGNKILRLGLFAAGVLHQVQNFRHGGLPKGSIYLHMEHPGEVDTAADHLVPRLHVPGQGLAGEGGGVQGGGALQHRAVQGDPLPGFYHDHIAHRDLLRVHLDQFSILLDVGVVRADVHEGGDRLAAAVHRHTLKQLTHLVEQHDGHRLGVLPAAEGPHCGHRHEEVLVKHLAVFDVSDGPPQHIPADDPIGDQIQHRPRQAGEGIRGQMLRQLQRQKQAQRRQNALPGLFLLLCHGSTPP